VAELDVTRNAVDEWELLNIKEIKAEGQVAVVLRDVRRQRKRKRCVYPLVDIRVVSRATFDESYVRPKDDVGSAHIVYSDGTVEDVAV
jgi:hypothetical protein